MSKDKLLLHVCCAPCATHAIEELQNDFTITLFFCNSNIHPREEYDKRFREVKKLGTTYNLEIAEDMYNHEAWRCAIRGFEDEPERSVRCTKCFEFNLSRTGQYALAHGYAAFTTTLTVSPHKHTPTIFAVGRKLRGFAPFDFKKKNGYKHSVDLSKYLNLYRQNYCGCEFSQRVASASQPCTERHQ